ncbi:sporulation protein [Catenovulum sp. SM1970]|uniref:sporulation protein n=1 Tax=Marinifaba aquimaris TaxID=2741323 RepID=UPI00157435A0|nr:sporulation protein [Marinifaba aquimaris]NTS78107.1 sporulation protein [Marinifaba aquimaris]
MSFFQKVLSTVGIGSAVVDTRLAEEQLFPGGTIHGTIFIQGGKVAQDINKIDLDIRCNYFAEVTHTSEGDYGEIEEETETVEKVATLSTIQLRDDFRIGPEQIKEIPFHATLPLNTPMTLGNSEIWIDTRLDIDFALDREDRDYLHVFANDYQLAFLQALENLGFAMVKAENEASKKWGQTFIQECEFKPKHGEFVGRVDEVEVIFNNLENGTEVYLEIDRKARGLSGFFASMLDLDETKAAFLVETTDVAIVQDRLATLLDQHS